MQNRYFHFYRFFTSSVVLQIEVICVTLTISLTLPLTRPDLDSLSLKLRLMINELGWLITIFVTLSLSDSNRAFDLQFVILLNALQKHPILARVDMASFELWTAASP